MKHKTWKKHEKSEKLKIIVFFEGEKKEKTKITKREKSKTKK